MANEVNVGIKLGADVSGGVQSREELDKLRKKAKETSAEASSGFSKMSSSIQGVSRVAGLCQRVLSGFGAVGAILGITQAITKVRESFAAAQKEAEKFNEAAAAKKVKESIDALADSYDRLSKSIAGANERRAAERELEELELKASRDLEDANIDLAEQRELEAVDSNDPAAAELRAEIQARYKKKRDNLAASRGLADAEQANWKLREDAQADRDAATKIDAAADDTEKAIAEARKRRYMYLGKAGSENDLDDQNAWDRAGSGIKKVFTLNWGKLGDDRTEEGDAERERNRQMAEQEDATIKQLEQQLEGQREQARKLRDEADRKEKRRSINMTNINAQRVRQTVTSIRGNAAEDEAEKATDKVDADIESAKEAAENLAWERDSLKERIEKEQAKRAAAGKAVFDAQGSLDLARANGDRAGQRTATAALREAQNAADEVNHATDGAIQALTKTLKDVEMRLKAAQSHLERSNSQRRAWEADAPSGSRQ